MDKSDRPIFEALNHPIRRKILQELARETELSPSECAKRLSVRLSLISYHVTILAACKAIVLVRTEPGRGSPKHFYRLAIEEPWAMEALGIAPPRCGGSW